MLVYTITDGATYSTDQYESKYTTSITNTYIYQSAIDCDSAVNKTFTYTAYTASTIQLFHNGREVSSQFISYKDQNPTSYKVFVFDTNGNCQGVGGYYQTNSFSIKGYTIYEPDGKKTEYTEAYSDAASKTVLQSTILKYTQEWNGTIAQNTTSTQTFDTQTFTTKTTNVSIKSSLVKVDDTLSLTNYQTTQITNVSTNTKVTRTVVTDQEKNTRLGYSYGGTEYTPDQNSPSIGFNYVNSVVFITNNNVLWYKDNEDGTSGSFLQKFKSTRGIGQQITLTYKLPTKQEVLEIGSSNCSQTFPATKKGTVSEYTKSVEIDYTATNLKVNYVKVGIPTFPLETRVVESSILTTLQSPQSFISKSSYTFSNVTAELVGVTNYKTLIQKINGNTLQFDRTYRVIDTIQDTKSFITSTFGECISSNTTYFDQINYTSLIKEGWSLSADVDQEQEFIFNRDYNNGQVAINNLSIVEKIKFKDNQTYQNIAGYPSSSLYLNVPIVFTNFAKSFTFIDNSSTKTAYSPIEDTNLKLDLRYVLVSSSQESTLPNQEKYTKIETTKHEFELEGDVPSTYLKYTLVQHTTRSLLIDPNQYCKFLESTIISARNCGVFCDDGKNTLTRIIYPGDYLGININGIIVRNISSVITTSQDKNTYYYLPWNNRLVKTRNGNLVTVNSNSYNISNFLPEFATMTNPAFLE